MAKDNTDDITGSVIGALSGVTTATLTTLLLKKGLRGVWMRGTGRCNRASRAWWDAPSRYASCRPARTWPRRNRGVRRGPPVRRDAGGLYRDGGRHGLHRRGHLRRHPVRADQEARGGRAGYRRSGARRRRRAGHRTTRLVSGHRRAAVGGRADVRGLAGADRLRRGRGVSRRPGGSGRRRCRRDPLRVGRGDGRRGAEAGAPGSLDHGRGGRRRAAAGACIPRTTRLSHATRLHAPPIRRRTFINDASTPGHGIGISVCAFHSRALRQ